MADRLTHHYQHTNPVRVYVMGEVYGDVQDLKYGLDKGQHKFLLFDITTWEQFPDSEPRFFHIPAYTLDEIAGVYGLVAVPQVCVGRWGEIAPQLSKYTEGQSLIAPYQMREGVVIRTEFESKHPRYGRKIAKSVSEAYLLRKGNVTEYN